MPCRCGQQQGSLAALTAAPKQLLFCRSCVYGFPVYEYVQYECISRMHPAKLGRHALAVVSSCLPFHHGSAQSTCDMQCLPAVQQVICEAQQAVMTPAQLVELETGVWQPQLAECRLQTADCSAHKCQKLYVMQGCGVCLCTQGACYFASAHAQLPMHTVQFGSFGI